MWPFRERIADCFGHVNEHRAELRPDDRITRVWMAACQTEKAELRTVNCCR